MSSEDAEPLGQAPEPAADPSSEETAQSELDLGMVSTGSIDVDRALRPLDGLAERPVAEHAEIFDQVLGELAETMTGPVAAQGATPGEPPATD